MTIFHIYNQYLYTCYDQIAGNLHRIVISCTIIFRITATYKHSGDLASFLVKRHLRAIGEKRFIGLFWCGLKTRNAVNNLFTAFLILIIKYLAES